MKSKQSKEFTKLGKKSQLHSQSKTGKKNMCQMSLFLHNFGSLHVIVLQLMINSSKTMLKFNEDTQLFLAEPLGRRSSCVINQHIGRRFKGSML